MKAYIFSFIFSALTALPFYADDIEVSVGVPLPPNAWSVSGIGSSLFAHAGGPDAAQFSWGNMSGQSDLIFSAIFSPLPPIPPETTALSIDFLLGELLFSNGGFPISTADLSLILTLDQGLDSDEITFDANFSFTSLPGEIELSFDSQTNTSPQPLAFNGKSYTVEILGFSETSIPEYIISSSFTVPYDGMSPGEDSRFLVARLTLTVPEPQTYLLLGTICAVAVFAKRRSALSG